MGVVDKAPVIRPLFFLQNIEIACSMWVLPIYSWYNTQCPSRLSVPISLLVWFGEELKFCSDGGVSGSKKCKRDHGGVCGSMESGGRFCVVTLAVAMKTFSHSVYFMKAFCKYCTFSAICKDNVAINVILFNRKQFVISTFDWSYARLTNSVAPEPAGSSPYSQEPATGPYPEPNGSTLHSRSQSP
jgi:hypothetical protein